MEKGAPPSIFVNDGSFMERFRQLQQEKDKEKEKVVSVEDSKPVKIVTEISNPRPFVKTSIGVKTNDAQKKGGKLAFSLKQKSKLLAPPVKLGTEEEDEDEEEEDAKCDQGFGSVKRQKLEQRDLPVMSTKQADVAPPPPSDPTVKKVADKLASFVAKNGRPFEHITRQKILEIHHSNFFLMRTVRTTSTMHSGCLKRKNLFHKQKNPA